MEITLEITLNEINGEPLKAMARKLGVLDKTQTRKNDFIRAIASCIRTRPGLLVASLTEPEKFLLAEIVYSGRVPTSSQFRAKYNQPFPVIHGYRYSGKEPSVLVGFVSSLSPMHVGVPQEILDTYKPFLPAPAAPEAKVLPGPPEAYEGRPVHVFSGERHIATELSRVLRLIHAGKIKVADSTRRPTDASTRLLAGALVQPDFALEAPKEETDQYTDTAGPVRAHAWGVLAQQCGWAKPRAGCLGLTATGKEILAAFTPAQFQAGVEEFLYDDAFDELNRINHIRGQNGKAKRWISAPADRKSSIADHIDVWPVGEWISFDEAFRLLQAAGANLDIFNSERGMLYICDAHYGTIYGGQEISRQFLRAFVMESLATLGLVDIAWVYPHWLWPEFKDSYGRDSHSFIGRYDGLQAVRLNALGAYCFGIRESFDFVPAAEEKRFHLLPNHDLTAVGSPDAADLAFLELIAIKKSEHVWRLDAPTILLAMQQGTRLPDVRDFLLNSCRQGIPANIDKWLEDLGEKAGACRTARRAVLLEWKDSVQAHLIATSPGTGKLCHLAGENRIAVAENHFAAFSREARKLGFLIPPIAK
jgi:hypothetical protein